MLYDEWKKPAPCQKINDFLASAQGQLTFAELAKLWQTTRVTFVFQRPPDLEGGMRLPSAIRGALGPPLRKIAERETAHPFGSLFHMMYADHFMFQDRWHTPKPFVIWVEETKGKIYVQISLFGIAGAFRKQLIEAMLTVMLPETQGGEGGISLMTGKRNRRIWPTIDMYWQESGHCPVAAARNSVTLGLRTPVIPTNGDVLSINLKEILATIFKRVVGLTLWHGLKCSDLLNFQAIDMYIDQLHPDLLSGLAFTKTPRRSRSFSEKLREPIGLEYTVKVSDFPSELWPGLVIGTMTHVGYDAPQGYGRFEICYP